MPQDDFSCASRKSLALTFHCPAAAPAADLAASPGSQPFNVAAGPVSAPSQAALQAPAPQPVQYVPPQAQVTTVFRLALIGEKIAPAITVMMTITSIMRRATRPEAYAVQASAPVADTSPCSGTSGLAIGVC